MTADRPSSLEATIAAAFRERASIQVRGSEVRSYPEETNVIVFVDESDLAAAATVGNQLDDELSDERGPIYVVVRKAPSALVSTADDGNGLRGVSDPRVSDLIRLITARSRVSVVQPSLSYVRDAKANLSAVTASRHQLIFGRRGAGKTALLVEAREQLTREGSIAAWVNAQTLRKESDEKVLLYVIDEVLNVLQASRRVVKAQSIVYSDLSELAEDVRKRLAQDVEPDTRGLVPRVQRVVSRFLSTEGVALYVFVDDFYYIPRDRQPVLLDALHGCVRDSNAWLKIASIRHLTRWFQSSPPIGLQTGHDADLIDLDVTLQDPARAQFFLESVLAKYAVHVGIPSLARVFSKKALDRLVLASGAVPRDYLTLAASSIAKAKTRPNASLVGAEDINRAAGDAAGAKLQELEEDMASNVGTADATLAALRIVRSFCLDENAYAFFLVRFRDKEVRAREYGLLTELLDSRLIHMLDAGVSDSHAAGERYEAFMLDLSQYSGSRLKRKIRVLDFANGRILSRQTGTRIAARVGDTPLQVISILRAAPTFGLDRLAALIADNSTST